MREITDLRDIQKLPFEVFVSAANVTDLPETHRFQFLSLMRSTYELCGDIWQPGDELYISAIAGFAALLVQKHNKAFSLVEDVQMVEYTETGQKRIEIKMTGIDQNLVFDPHTPLFGFNSNHNAEE